MDLQEGGLIGASCAATRVACFWSCLCVGSGAWSGVVLVSVGLRSGLWLGVVGIVILDRVVLVGVSVGWQIWGVVIVCPVLRCMSKG